MDPNEIVKHAPDILKSGGELLKGGAALAGTLKFTDIIKAMLGPATAEVAERFRDDVRLYRYGRQLECLKKAEKMAKDAGYTPQAVPIKILFPLLEGASLEESEDLHTMWAALLANAASPNAAGNVRPGFIAILREMSPDEAELLKEMSAQRRDAAILSSNTEKRLTVGERAVRKDGRKRLRNGLRAAFRPLDGEAQKETDARYLTCLRVLEHAGLVTLDGKLRRLAPLGATFLMACDPPKAEI